MQRCSERAFARCIYRERCGTREAATFTENSDCAAWNKAVEEMPITNGDRIRAMSDEELARVLYSLVNLVDEIPYCKNLPECEAFLDGGGIPERKCVQCLAEWLRQPVEVPDGG